MMNNIEVENLHTIIKNIIYGVFSSDYREFEIVKECKIEEGCFLYIKNIGEEKIIGIVPINSECIYTVDEMFEIKDFTSNTVHFIHKILK